MQLESEEDKMQYIIYDGETGDNIGPFDDYEAAEIFMLHASNQMFNQGESLSLQPLNDTVEWCLDNGIVLDEVTL